MRASALKSVSRPRKDRSACERRSETRELACPSPRELAWPSPRELAWPSPHVDAPPLRCGPPALLSLAAWASRRASRSRLAWECRLAFVVSIDGKTGGALGPLLKENRFFGPLDPRRAALVAFDGADISDRTPPRATRSRPPPNRLLPSAAFLCVWSLRQAK